MSIKTLRKRIALVAVSALGAGLLSVAPASASTAIFITGGISGNGIIVAPAGSGTTQTITISSNTELAIAMVAGSDSGAKVTVTGGTIVRNTGAGVGTSTSYTFGTATPTITFKPDEGSGVMTVSTCVSSSACTAGTVAAKLVATVKSAASQGIVSASNSKAKAVAAGSPALPADSVDTTAGKNVPITTAYGQIDFTLRDGNDVAMSTSTVVTASATGGCLVSDNAASGYYSGSASQTYDATTGYDAFYFARSVTNAPFTCVVTLSANGVLFATKTIILQGKVTKVEVDDGQAGISVADAGSSTSSAITSESAFTYSAYDAAGNLATGLTISNSTVSTDAVTSVTTSDATATTGAYGDITCAGAAKKGSSTFYLYYVNNANETIKSPTYTVTCAGRPVTYTASLDKASYLPGEIATLTITAKDSAGNLTNDFVYLGGEVADGSGKDDAPSIAGAYLTAITAASSTDMFVSGVKKYKFIVGSTEGNYQLAVDLPKFNNTTYSQSAVTVPYSIKSGSTAVSNAEVLAAIVKLIASINKQIRALQKSLRR